MTKKTPKTKPIDYAKAMKAIADFNKERIIHI